MENNTLCCLLTPWETTEDFTNKQDFNCGGEESDEDKADLEDHVRHSSELLNHRDHTYNKDEGATDGLSVAVSISCQIFWN